MAATTENADESASQSIDLEPWDIHEALIHARRYWLVEVLKNHPEGIEFKEAAKRVASRECNSDIESLTQEEIHRVEVSFYQGHVEHLWDKGILECERIGGPIRPGPNAHEAILYQSFSEMSTKLAPILETHSLA